MTREIEELYSIIQQYSQVQPLHIRKRKTPQCLLPEPWLQSLYISWSHLSVPMRHIFRHNQLRDEPQKRLEAQQWLWRFVTVPGHP